MGNRRSRADVPLINVSFLRNSSCPAADSKLNAGSPGSPLAVRQRYGNRLNGAHLALHCKWHRQTKLSSQRCSSLALKPIRGSRSQSQRHGVGFQIGTLGRREAKGYLCQGSGCRKARDGQLEARRAPRSDDQARDRRSPAIQSQDAADRRQRGPGASAALARHAQFDRAGYRPRLKRDIGGTIRKDGASRVSRNRKGDRPTSSGKLNGRVITRHVRVGVEPEGQLARDWR